MNPAIARQSDWNGQSITQQKQKENSKQKAKEIGAGIDLRNRAGKTEQRDQEEVANEKEC